MHGTVLNLVALIYDAVANPSRWHAFLEAFVKANRGSRGSILVSSGLDDSTKDIVCWHGWKDKDIKLYMERYVMIDPWHAAFAHISEGDVLTSQEVCSEEQFRAGIAFNEFYRPLDVHYGLGGAFLKTEEKMSAIFMQRSETEGPCGKRELAITRSLMPHLRRAGLLHSELASLRAKLSAFSSHVDRYPQPFLLTNGDRRILYSNEAGREIMQRGDGFSVDFGFLKITSFRKDAQFRNAVLEIAARPDAPLQRIVVDRPNGKIPYRILLMPLASLDMIRLGVLPPAVAIIIIDAGTAPQPDPAMLRELFSLTAAEARVTALLVQGRSIDEAAMELSISRETVRTHTRRVLSKTATNRQGELISLVLRSMPFREVSRPTAERTPRH